MSVLGKLKEKKIVQFLLVDKKSIEVQELCDMYYKTTLSKSEMIELAKEIQAIADRMED